VPELHAPELVEVVQAGKPVGAMMLSKSNIAGPPDVSCTVSKAVIGVEAISLIVPVVPVLKIGSPPDTAKGVAVPEHAGAMPEKAMQGVLLDTDNSAVLLFLIKSPLPGCIGMGVANTLGAMAITASPIEAMPATLRPIADFLNLLICFNFFSSVWVHSGFDPGFKYAIASRACLGE